jgi:Pvc16 N-terminal domain
MSNALAIATVTATLSDVIERSAQSIVPGATVVVGRPPATVAAGEHHVYLYLYHVVPHPGLRNDDLPTRNGDELRNRPRIPLVLHYLLVFQGDNATFEAERMLGTVVRDFHARPLLARTDIQLAITTRTELDGSNLPDAIERIRLTQTPLTLEELSKLWSIFFQVPHAVSVAYEASLVELEADDTPRTPLPVLYRGDRDRGVYLLVGPFPSIEAIRVAEGYPRAALGLKLIVTGQQLAGKPLQLRFRHTRLDTPPNVIDIPDADAMPDRLVATIPSGLAANAAWAAGIVEVTLESGANAPPRLSNTVPLALAPTIQNVAPAGPIARDASGNASITVTMVPDVRSEQRVSLLLNGSETMAPPRAAPTGTITFVVERAEPVQNARVQVRVDGVDSMPFRRTGTPPVIEFDPAQMVTIA